MKLLNKITATDEPTLTLENVGPDQAAAMLECNRNNRHLSDRTVDSFARDMAAGNWRMTGEAIKFDIDGDLLDGQHRLWAIVQSGVTVPLIVVRGLRPDAQDVMDTGRKRTAADALGLNGFSHGSILAASVRLLINYEAGNLKKAAQQNLQAVTHAEVFSYIDANPGILDAARWANGHRGTPTRKGPTAACLYTLRKIDAEQADEFFTDLNEMRTSGKGDPRLTLLRRMQLAKERGERIGAIEEMHYIFRTWNAIRQGEDLRQLKTGNGSSAFDFARPS